MSSFSFYGVLILRAACSQDASRSMSEKVFAQKEILLVQHFQLLFKLKGRQC